MYIRPRLPEHQRSRDTMELMQVPIGLLVTFAALVLGLLTASVKQSYDNSAHDRQEYALQLTLLDRCLRDYGPESNQARMDLRNYTAAVVASTWPNEPAPVGVSYPNVSDMPRTGASPVLGDLMQRIGLEVSALTPTDSVHGKIAQLCLDRYNDVLRARIGVIEAAQHRLFEPF